MGDTSTFIVEAVYWRVEETGCVSRLFPIKAFTLNNLMPGSVYWYVIRVTQNGDQIGDNVDGTFLVPPTTTATAMPSTTPTVTTAQMPTGTKLHDYIMSNTP